MTLWLFVELHKIPVRVLREDPSNEKAKALLRKMGSCHELFRSTLKRIISAEPLWMRPAPSNKTHEDIYTDMKYTLGFFQSFTNCLAPLPVTLETKILVRRAHAALMKPSVRQQIAIYDSDETHGSSILFYLKDETWKLLKKESSDQNRWLRFQIGCLQYERNHGPDRTTDKIMRRSIKEKSQQRLEHKIGHDEMCANCFVMEKDIECQSHLMKCSQCRQVTYCSAACQREHWKKAHKKQCS
jgi:hypothetical protein